MTGSTGIIYGIRMLEILKKKNIQTHLIISEWAKKCLTMESDFKLDYVKSLASTVSDETNMAASISSGTHRTDGMIVIPCSMKTLSSIANGYDETLLARAAGVTLKESRKLILVTRETPLTAINLENMLKLARLGVVILPPVPGFYTKPKTIDEIVIHTVGKCLDQFNIEHNLYKRWGE
jgi:4-hydroxy-3-polyprenylbenzoate decarboxylase